MTQLKILIGRNIRLFFKDKGLFFTSLITPMILLVLYATFLGNIYRDSFLMSVPGIDEALVNACVGGQLLSSILSVSAVTVAVSSNMLMVQDKANGTLSDLMISPVRPSTLSLAYYIATLVSTLTVCFSALAVCLIYVACIGWYMSLADVLLIVLDVLILVLFGTALSSVINFFLSTQGQISAVGSIISSCYGFICGAYMPISQFSKGLRNTVGVLPGTYGTSLLRRHALAGAIREMEESGIPEPAITAMRDAVDINIYFGDATVPVWVMYTALIAVTVLLIGAYVLENVLRERNRSK